MCTWDSVVCFDEIYTRSSIIYNFTANERTSSASQESESIENASDIWSLHQHFIFIDLRYALQCRCVENWCKFGSLSVKLWQQSIHDHFNYSNSLWHSLTAWRSEPKCTKSFEHKHAYSLYAKPVYSIHCMQVVNQAKIIDLAYCIYWKWASTTLSTHFMPFHRISSG